MDLDDLSEIFHAEKYFDHTQFKIVKPNELSYHLHACSLDLNLSYNHMPTLFAITGKKDTVTFSLLTDNLTQAIYAPTSASMRAIPVSKNYTVFIHHDRKSMP